MEYSFEDKDGYFIVEASGVEQDVEEMYLYISGILAHSRETGIKHVLLDEVRATLQHDAADDLEISMSAYAEQLGKQFVKIACVGKEERLPMVMQFEQFAQGRGLNFRGFKTLEEANDWLVSAGD